MPEDGGLINQALIGLKPVNACVHTYTKPQTSSTRSRGLGWRIHESVEDTKLSTNKQHTLTQSKVAPGSPVGRRHLGEHDGARLLGLLRSCRLANVSRLPHQRIFGTSQQKYERKERVCCLLVLNLVSSTLSCIRRPRPRLRAGGGRGSSV